MKTADRIEIDYRAAKMVGREHSALLEIEDDGRVIAVVKNDATGENTNEWEIYVDRHARRQVARVYVPRTGFEAAISAFDAATIIMLDRDPELIVVRSRELAAHDRKMKAIALGY